MSLWSYAQNRYNFYRTIYHLMVFKWKMKSLGRKWQQLSQEDKEALRPEVDRMLQTL